MNIKDRLDNCKSSGFHVSCDVDVVHARNGEVLNEQKLHNIVVNYGLNFVMGLVASSAATDHANFVGPNLSLTAPGATDVTMVAADYAALSGLERAAGTIVTNVASIGMYQTSKTFTASITASVGSVGLYTQTSGNNLFAGVSLGAGAPVLQALDTLAITWTVSFA